LAVEEQFYIFWPVLIFLFKKYGQLKKIIIGLIGIALVFRYFMWMQYPHEVEVFYCNTITRMDSLLMGSLLAVHLKEGKTISMNFIRGSIACFVALIAASLILFGNIKQDNALFPTIGYTISAIFFTSLLYVILKTEFNPLGRIRHLKILSYLGKISYGIYVFHIPIYLILSTQLTKIFATSFPPRIDEALMISGISVLLTIGLASISFYLIERPILRLKKHFP
jgi:peptidoglycan/LPS O-acetylase OafA/YrhL